AVGTLTFGRSAYENVVCLGLVTDAHGRKMSKHLGNVIEPMGLLDSSGADAVRWYFAASGSPWGQRRIGPAVLDEIVRKVLLTYWNTVSFLTLYANAAAADGNAWGPDRLSEAPAPAQRPVLDRWVLSELHTLVRDVTDLMEGFDTAGAGRRIAGFLDDLSNWYVRRSRRRFWEGPRTPASASAFATLYECLETVTRLMAPITPFLTDYVWSALRTADEPESVHLARWPEADPALIDEELSAEMALARRLVELGRSARATATVKTRQPLARALVGAPGFGSLPGELRAQVAEELNVHTLEPLATVGGDLVDYTVKPNFRTLGRRFGKGTPAVATAIGAADGAELAEALRTAGEASVTVDGEPVTVGPDEVVVTQTPKEGWTVASDGGETVALETSLTPELRREGLAREVIRLVQDARKSDGLDVTDRIQLWWEASDPELTAALEEQGSLIANEVLATSYQPGHPPADVAAGAFEHRDTGLGLAFWLAKA
ncbi:MAG: class I tRNA ligase family protein, partial [Actinobacteria bacterium]|nr:class I tRNA ligase family protein [Actinomycetota bacterium]